MREGTKPTLVYFQYEYDAQLPAFLIRHAQEHVRCLAEFFNVIVVNYDGDFLEICDKYEPDMVLVEGGVPFATCRRPHIRNKRACATVPKAGFLNADAFGEGRAAFLSDMEEWGITTAFAIATAVPEYNPRLIRNLFIWPNFVDSDTYRDYGQWKSIPVLFTGNKNALYPWRRRILRLVSAHYPSLISPHPGYEPRKSMGQILTGEAYARQLNSSWVVPACGTIAKEVVRKHFEIPACRACLVTERTPMLESAGFVDMQNCVFADHRDILDKLAYLFERPGEFQALIDRGFELVHSRHTMKHRNQVLQWLTLLQEVKPGENIVQTTPFEPLMIASNVPSQRRDSISIHLSLIEQGDRKLQRGDYEGAYQLYLQCLHYYRFMPEPLLRLAICSLNRGNASEALEWVSKPLRVTLEDCRAKVPDPVEWTYLIVCHLCFGNLKEAVRLASDFPEVRYAELDYTRWIVALLSSTEGNKTLPVRVETNSHISLHELPGRTPDQWVEHVCTLLTACGRTQFSRTLMTRLGGAVPPMQRGTRARRIGRTKVFCKRALTSGAFSNSQLTVRLRRLMKSTLHTLERKYGYFLPHQVSCSRTDELYEIIQQACSDDDVQAVLVIGANPQQRCTQAALAGARENTRQPQVYCFAPDWLKLRPTHSTTPQDQIQWLRLTSVMSHSFETAITQIRTGTSMHSFDVVIIDGSELRYSSNYSRQTEMIRRELKSARLAIIDDINHDVSCEYYAELLEDPTFLLIDHNPGLRGGFAAFERTAGTSQTAQRQIAAQCTE